MSAAKQLREFADHIELGWEKQLPTSPHVATALRTLADELTVLECQWNDRDALLYRVEELERAAKERP